MNDEGFHEGERLVQRRAGVVQAADRLEGMLRPPRLTPALGGHLAERTFAVVTARDGEGTLWVSPLAAEPGFLGVRGSALTVAARPAPGDPLHTVPAPQDVGLLVIDLGLRRRVRVNGRLTDSSDGSLTIEPDQAYGNCPAYIQERHLTAAPATAAGTDPAPTGPAAGMSGALEADDIALVRAADTFFLGTAHPERGADASHKGGEPGFVRVEGGEIWWPDYAGNNLFNSLGNITADPVAALLFVDFATGRTLHLAGEARVEWLDPADRRQDEGGTGRRVRFTPRRVRRGRARLRGRLLRRSPRNPAVGEAG
ncbi:pyridoxamine 5'-phosphate oxidase-related FMN-binding protein [Streptomyces zinciresistens K42]|uniref:Pyridoxamine 5'-phosphate oxidase-related FMN-binding protein n=1 Tax=Streptomyces zinciresistens K42 TaxID=700597 RepID=G2GLF0_9ACTN|nr:pyridoxamine 5'-phosphate oxidase family protein [Streptomyces zinciresistens]EGX55672.1 pyridoxamine 5'-phosphate oxidase-related FMN-binding protein [Streptomyces zinciresistens K42]